jgi:hypothetical protein
VQVAVSWRNCIELPLDSPARTILKGLFRLYCISLRTLKSEDLLACTYLEAPISFTFKNLVPSTLASNELKSSKVEKLYSTQKFLREVN